MTGTNYLYNDYLALANKIRESVKEQFGYTVNIGIANNKLCAKMASDFEKPDKVHTLYNEEIKQKLWPLAVGDLLMVGKSSKQLLNKLNIYTIGQLANADDKLLYKHFKNQATYLKRAAWGIDDTKVEPRSNKTTSVSISKTLPYDCSNRDKLKEILLCFTEEVTRELRLKKQYAKTVAVFFKTNNFISYSAQEKLVNPSNNTKKIYETVVDIFNKNYKDDLIRLIGLRLADLSEKCEKQLTIFESEVNEETESDEVQKTIDNINQKFGKSIITTASLKVRDINKTNKL